MSTEIAVAASRTVEIYSRVSDPIHFANEMAQTAAHMMGAPVEQGKAIALACLCEGMTLMEYRRRYHWISGKPSMRADAMLAEFRQRFGGNYRIVERTSERCHIVFTDIHGNEFVANVPWSTFEESRWPWRNPADHGKGLKENWSTSLDRQAMMFARVVSDSLRAICPELVAGVYTPEEQRDIDTVESVAVRPTVGEVLAEGGPADAPASVVAGAAPADAGQEAVSNGPPSPASRNTAAPGSIRESQILRIRNLFESCGVSHEKQTAAIAKRNCSSLHNFSEDQAVELLEKLESLEKQKATPAGE